MELIITSGGEVHCLYDETIDLSGLGDVHIRRASHVEPDEAGKWWADLSPASGPRLGPFRARSEAIDAEVQWLRHQLRSACVPRPLIPRSFTPWQMHSQQSSSSTSSSSSSACVTSAVPEEPSCPQQPSPPPPDPPQIRPFTRFLKWLRRLAGRVLLIFLLCLSLRLAVPILWRRLTQPWGMIQTHRSGLTVEQIHQLAVLVTAKVTIADAQETTLSGKAGACRAILMFRGEVMLGPDLSQARVIQTDSQAKKITIELPRPRPVSIRLDHSASRLVSLGHNGLWVIVPGDAGRTAVVNEAYRQAEEALAVAATKPEAVEQATRHAQTAITDFLATGGWTVEIKWMR